jgi:7-cyano-7-deazaguanine synthase
VTTDSRAILVSGGLDSAILLGESLHSGLLLTPLYIRSGLVWEPAELASLRRFLEALKGPQLKPLHILDMPVGDLYGNHWSLTGLNVPNYHSPDSAVFLPGRNILLLAKAILWCHLHQVPGLALAPLAGNPFPDATPAFFSAFESIVNQGVASTVKVLRPYAHLSKRAVMERAGDLPLRLTFSCLHPVNGLHCGACNKCAERRRAFRDSGRVDETVYHSE